MSELARSRELTDIAWHRVESKLLDACAQHHPTTLAAAEAVVASRRLFQEHMRALVDFLKDMSAGATSDLENLSRAFQLAADASRALDQSADFARELCHMTKATHER